MSKYCVNITTYEDDYKHRYDSGVYNEEPEFFNDKREAEAFVLKRVIEEIIDRDGNNEDLEEIADHLTNKYLEAEFVDNLIEWNITEIKTKNKK